MEARSRAGLALVVAVALVVAWRNRFIQDDAFISLRYARHLVDGHGLVWNIGERVEGYTSFLWTVLGAVPLRLGLDPVGFLQVAGLLLFAVTLAALARLVRGLTGHHAPAVPAVAGLGLFYSASAYATGGLETQLQAALVTLTAVVAAGVAREGRLEIGPAAVAGALSTLALLTRLDSSVFLVPMLGVAALSVRAPFRPVAARAVALAAVIPLVVLGAWLAWKQGFYGHLLPNTLAAKTAGSRPDGGWRFLGSFVLSYAFLPVPLAGALALREGWRARRHAEWMTLGAPLVAWVLYVAAVGGDFMEYRMLVPALPLAFALASWCVWLRWRSLIAAWVLTAAVLAGSELHRRFGNPYRTGGPEPVRSLAARLSPEGDQWRVIGERLGAAFGEGERPRIAVTAAGAIPFYSGLPAVDMLVLNDPELHRFEVITGYGPGHTRLSPLDLLLERRVNFLIAHPVLKDRSARPPADGFSHADFSEGRPFRFTDEERLRGLPLVEVPLEYGRVLLMVYLTRDPGIDRRLDALGWRWYPAP